MYDPLSDDFKRSEFPFYWIAQVNALYTNEMERLLKRIDMDVPQWRIMMILVEHSELSISEIAKHAIAKLPTTTKIIYRMRDEGLLHLKTSPEDGRVTLVSLTEKGLEHLDFIRDAVSLFFKKGFRGLTTAQIDRTNHLLMLLHDNLENLSDY